MAIPTKSMNRTRERERERERNVPSDSCQAHNKSTALLIRASIHQKIIFVVVILIVMVR
jgi:hypothetical protein